MGQHSSKQPLLYKNEIGYNTRLQAIEKQLNELQQRTNENIHLQYELKRQTERADKWAKAYSDLHKKHEKILNLQSQTKNKEIQKQGAISNEAIDKFVDEILADPNINIYCMPDTIEKPLYTNFLKILIGLIQKSFEHTRLDIIGHEFKVQLI